MIEILLMLRLEVETWPRDQNIDNQQIIFAVEIIICDNLVAHTMNRIDQPRPQGLLGFQYGGGSGEDPGTQQITCLQRGWRCIQNGGYGEKGEKNGYEMLR